METAGPTGPVLPDALFRDLDRASKVPLYAQVAATIEAAIASGELGPGTRIDNEVDLAARLGLSRPTVRQAIQQLVDRGIVVRRRGVGTQIVRGHLSRSIELTSLYDDMERSGRAPETVVLVHEEVTPPDDAAAELRTPSGATVLHLRRVRYAGPIPVAVLENWLPAEFLSISRTQLEANSLYRLLRDRGAGVQVAHQRIGARATTQPEAELLGIAGGSALLTLERTGYDTGGRAVEFARHCYRPDLYSFELRVVGR